MNLILLGGNNVGNKKWIESMEVLFKPYFQTHILYYNHWKTGNEWVNPELELKRLCQTTNKLENYIIFSRSAGTMITLMGASRGVISPAKCIFVGISIKWSSYFDPDYESWLKNFKIPSLMIQKSFDPAISAANLRKFLVENNFAEYNLKEIPGEDHYYGNIEELKDLTLDFCLPKKRSAQDEFSYHNKIYSAL